MNKSKGDSSNGTIPFVFKSVIILLCKADACTVELRSIEY